MLNFVIDFIPYHWILSSDDEFHAVDVYFIV